MNLTGNNAQGCPDGVDGGGQAHSVLHHTQGLQLVLSKRDCEVGFFFLKKKYGYWLMMKIANPLICFTVTQKLL